MTDDIDDKIRAALRAADSELSAELADDERTDSLRDHIRQMYVGRSRAMLVITRMKLVFSVGLAISSSIAFLYSDTVKWQIACAALFVVAVLGVGTMWTFFWLQLNRNAGMRELKRLELRIASLAEPES